MMGNSFTFALPDSDRLGGKLTRMVDRWRSGGVELYAAEASEGLTSNWSGERFSVSHERIWLDELPEIFSGLRVVQISDVHHGLFLPQDWLADAVRQANRLNPDVVALTGDFVTYSRSNMETAAKILGRLRARHGVFAVLGNHDFRVDADRMTSALQRHQIEVLRNRHIPLHLGNQTLYLAGVDDFGYGADMRRALHGIPQNAATVLLAHNPRLISSAARHGVSLVLSGHTHGGQVNLPLLGTVFGRSPERLRFKMGWDCMGSTQIYVTRGIGTIVLPWRLRCPAEITHLELLRGASAFSQSSAAD